MMQWASGPHGSEAPVSFLKKLFGSNSTEPPRRVRVCVECGMPVAEHKEWCSILRIKQAMEQKRASAAASQG